MKGDVVFKRSVNAALAHLAGLQPGARLDSETGLQQRLGVSRTTVRKVLRRLAATGVIGPAGIGWMLLRVPLAQDAFAPDETQSAALQVERKFMEWMLRSDSRPGDAINELDLARQFGVSTSGIREFLNRFSRFRLIERRAPGGWRFGGFTRDFALELVEVREMFETRAALALAALPPEAAVWGDLRAIEAEHHALLARIDTDFHDFSELDARFHRLVWAAAGNRFVMDFYDLISLIFHYHYQWNKADERQRNAVAIAEHLDYIAALLGGDAAGVERACRRHLTSARATLLASVAGIGG